MSGDFPATECGYENSYNHKRVVAVTCPTAVCMFVHRDWRSGAIQSLPGHGKLRRILSSKIVTLMPPKKFLAKSGVLWSVMRQTPPHPGRWYECPELGGTYPRISNGGIRRWRYERMLRQLCNWTAIRHFIR